jgi:hypothetical protein
MDGRALEGSESAVDAGQQREQQGSMIPPTPDVGSSLHPPSSTHQRCPSSASRPGVISRGSRCKSPRRLCLMLLNSVEARNERHGCNAQLPRERGPLILAQKPRGYVQSPPGSTTISFHLWATCEAIQLARPCHLFHFVSSSRPCPGFVDLITCGAQESRRRDRTAHSATSIAADLTIHTPSDSCTSTCGFPDAVLCQGWPGAADAFETAVACRPPSHTPRNPQDNESSTIPAEWDRNMEIWK